MNRTAAIRQRLAAAPPLLGQATVPEHDQARPWRERIANVCIEWTVDLEMQVVPLSAGDTSLAEFIAGAYRDVSDLLEIADRAQALLELFRTTGSLTIESGIYRWQVGEESVESEEARDVSRALSALADALGWEPPA